MRPFGAHGAASYQTLDGEASHAEVRIRFAILRELCKYKRGDMCDRGQGECKLENCLHMIT